MKYFLFASVLLVLGAGCAPAQVAAPSATQTPGQTPTPPPPGVELRPPVEYGTPFTLDAGDARVFSDGLQVTLTDINDSRCKPGNTCIWAGELAYTLAILNVDKPDAAQELKLGALTKKEGQAFGKTFTLEGGDETSVTISVK